MQNHITGKITLVVLVIVVAALVVSLFSRTLRPKLWRASYLLLGGVIALYAVGRGIAEFWVVNYSDPSSYRLDWGGPSLIGVFAVHSGPGLLVLIAGGVWLYKRHGKKHHTTQK